jgi:glyoxylase-like metal-dependent hydrolase (beta-lactamase superfamily II)
VRARNPSEWTGPTGNNTFLLTGSSPALVDAGVGNPEHVNEIAACLGGVNLERVLITHGHPDHVSGVPAITLRWPQVQVLRYPDFDSDGVSAGDTRLQPIHTPGHAPDHVCFFDSGCGDLYCGDLVRAGGTVVIPASRGGNLGDYLASLERVKALAPRRLLPGHGPMIDDPLPVIEEYIRHRQWREQQVLSAMREGRSTADGITAVVYAGLAPGLVAAAADTVLAHLQYLEETGRAIRQGSAWTAT